MDSSQFDRLIRAYSQRRARRGVLAGLVGGLVLLGGGLPGEAKKKKPKKPKRKCQKGAAHKTLCYGVGCRDLLTDVENCGTCQHRCDADQTCVGGTCTGGAAAPPPPPPPPPGGCPCPFNQVCENDACVPAPDRCGVAMVCAEETDDNPIFHCGTVAGAGGPCGCFVSTENNFICINERKDTGGPIDPSTLISCNDSQHCRETAGLHYYCRKCSNETVGRCWPECDNPN